MADTYLEKRIKHISDEDLFASLKLREKGLAHVRRAAAAGDTLGAIEAWHTYLKRRLKRSAKPASAARAVTGLGPQVRDPERKDVLERADRVVARDIDCWGGIRIQYDGEIDFSRNLGGSSNYGFHYFGWISPLKAAYQITGDEIYARTFVEIFKQWYRQRDQVQSDLGRLDVIWYELGCNRVRVFRDLYFAMIESAAFVDPEFHLMMMKSILGHPRWLHRHQTEYHAGNWQVFGAQTLVGIGLTFPEFSESCKWTRRGLKWILEHTRRDVHADGCHKERAPHYHLGVVNSFWDVYNVLVQARAFPKERRRIGQVCERMLEWTLGVMTPCGHSPTVGDSEYDIPQSQFLRIGAARGNAALLWASGATAADIRSSRESQGVKKATRPSKPEAPSVHHASSGFAVVRDRWHPEGLYLNVNYGPYGGGHSHNEALAFQMWAKGSPVAVDCGRGISYDDPLHGPWYKSVYAHNTVAVDGAGPSLTGSRGKLAFWTAGKDVDFLGMTHRGYEESGVAHRRCYLINKAEQYAVVLDFLDSDTDHLYEWVLNTPERVVARRNKATGGALAVVEADSGNVEGVEVSPATMALPLTGRTTWGVPRAEGRNVRIAKRGDSVRYAVLVMPGKRPGSAGIAVEQEDARSRYRLAIAVSGDGFAHSYEVDCRKGTIGR
jgi:hypothetical protein